MHMPTPNYSAHAVPDEVLFVPPAKVQALTPEQQALVAEAVGKVAASADLHPAVTIIHNLFTDSVEYMSDLGLQLLNTTLEEVKALGPAYSNTFFNAADAPNYLPVLYGLVQSLDPKASVSFFQQVRTAAGGDFAWYLSTTRVLLREPGGPPLLLITTACPVDPQHHLTHKLSRLLEENNFLRRHAVAFASLTTREREVLRHLSLGLTAPEIASALFLAPQTVQTHRRNIRHKLNASSAFELGQYARAFDLI